ncbi:hypothetical protein [Beggiatoa leptomitoformis]|uniref:Uncharacterized protein n=1 Tax=Beggiatoa leptomitoformis TaxID=288004 RepID=A0A2N9YEA2_9GAMM|nr:hypothetical protein [Beggiatoa leptomitoformis]ALG68937.1 hypothetical protein AL038_16080 [Beggiatoa leptomitoformis]AUI68679.1 hypothetical protein BLE401_08170 [Beggiatoa leptomitoformis]
MNIGELSKLEHHIMFHILSSHFGETMANVVLHQLIVKERTFTTSSIMPSLCSGSFTDFEPFDNSRLGKLDCTYYADAEHPLLPGTGCSIVLFATEDRTSFNFLELSFYGESLPIDLVTAELHGFTIITYDPLISRDL